MSCNLARRSHLDCRGTSGKIMGSKHRHCSRAENIYASTCFPLTLSFAFTEVFSMLTLELAQITFFFDELIVVMFAVESALMCNVVGWANHTTSMAAFEAALVIRSSINRNLLADKS